MSLAAAAARVAVVRDRRDREAGLRRAAVQRARHAAVDAADLPGHDERLVRLDRREHARLCGAQCGRSGVGVEAAAAARGLVRQVGSEDILELAARRWITDTSAAGGAA